MDVSDYRKQFGKELEAAAKTRRAAASRAPADDVDAALRVLDDRAADPRRRTDAARAVGGAVGERPQLIDTLIARLRDGTDPPELRLAALRALQRATFLAGMFAQKRPGYLEALRSIVDDPDATLRRRAIGILAREQDEYVQRRLLEGLGDRSKALVPAAKAIQFLGYDVHAEHFPILRRIVTHPPNQAAKREAVRLLAADPGSRDLLEGLLEDRNENREVRMISAVALQSLAPRRFEELARRIVLDDGEDDRLRATCINALTHFGDPAAYARDRDFAATVERLRRTSSSPQLKRASTRYQAKVQGRS